MSDRLVFGICLGICSTVDILRLVAKKYIIYRDGDGYEDVEVEEFTNFEQLEATCRHGEEFEIELYEDIESAGAKTTFTWEHDYISDDDNELCYLYPEAYKFKQVPLIIGNRGDCTTMIYKSTERNHRVLEIPESDLELLMQTMRQLKQADRISGAASIGICTW